MSDKLLTEIEKMIAQLDQPMDMYETQASGISLTRTWMEQVHKLVIADRARQQAEKEKMIAELEAMKAEAWRIRHEQSDEYYKARARGIEDCISVLKGEKPQFYFPSIIQGKQKEEEVSK